TSPAIACRLLSRIGPAVRHERRSRWQKIRISRSCLSKPRQRRRKRSGLAGSGNDEVGDMPIPWLRIIDAVLGVTDQARSRTPATPVDPDQQLQFDPGRAGPLGGLETRLAGVMVAALKEAFERDTRRRDLERATS